MSGISSLDRELRAGGTVDEDERRLEVVGDEDLAVRPGADPPRTREQILLDARPSAARTFRA